VLGTPTGTVTVDDGDGATCSAPSAAGSCQLTSTLAGTLTLSASFASDSAAFTDSVGSAEHVVSPAAAHHLTVVSQPVTGTVNQDLGTALVIASEDAYGNRVPGAVITISLYDPYPETAWLTGLTTATAGTAGTVAFDAIDIDTPGVYVIEATSPGLEPALSDPITIAGGGLLSTVASGDAGWDNHVDGVDVLFQRTGTGSSTRYTLRATSPGTFKYELELENETGTSIHRRGQALPPIIRNGVSLTDRNGATTTVYLTVPSMPASVGTPSPLTSSQKAEPAFVLAGPRPVRAYPTPGSEDDHERRQDEHQDVTISWIAAYPAGVSRCEDVPDGAWNSTPLNDGAVIRCIRIQDLAIPRSGQAFVRVSYEFRWKNTPGWGSASSDAALSFRAGFNFPSTTVVKLDAFNDDLLDHSHHHWGRLGTAQRDKLLGDFAALWGATYRGSQALGLAFAGERLTAVGGFAFDAGAQGIDGVTVRAFSVKPAGNACDPSLVAGTGTFMADYTTGPDGFYFLWQKGHNDGSGTGVNTLPSGYRYYLALCDLTAAPGAGTVLPFDQLYWPARSMASTLGNREFVEEDFFVSGPTRLAFQAQPTSGRVNRTLGTVKVALLDAFGNVMTVDGTSRVTLSAVTSAGSSTALVSTLASQPLLDRTLTAGTATWTGLRFTATGLFKIDADSSLGGIADERSLPINIGP
jgi:hypothetical protein